MSRLLQSVCKRVEKFRRLLLTKSFWAAPHADGQATIQHHCGDGGGSTLSNGCDTTDVFNQQVSHLDVAATTGQSASDRIQ